MMENHVAQLVKTSHAQVTLGKTAPTELVVDKQTIFKGGELYEKTYEKP